MNRILAKANPKPLQFAPLDISRPATQQIASQLRSAILSMQLEPGQMMSENEIGQMFAASRTPVREAFARLREDGLLETRPSRGTFVSMLSESQTRGAQFLREALEVAVVVQLCNEGLSEESKTALEVNLEKQRIAIAAEDKAAFQQLDDEFHGLLVQATGIARLSTVLWREKSVLDRLRVLSLNDSSHMSRLLLEHEQIIQAILNGDKEQAVSQVQTHLRDVLNLLTRLVKTNQDYFDTSDR